MIKLVKKIRRSWKDGYLLLNHGYRHLDEWGDKIDGVMYEDKLTKDQWDQRKDDLKRLAYQMEVASKKHPLDSYGLFYLDKEEQSLTKDICSLLTPYGFVTSFYSTNEQGMILQELPFHNCD